MPGIASKWFLWRQTWIDAPGKITLDESAAAAVLATLGTANMSLSVDTGVASLAVETGAMTLTTELLGSATLEEVN